MLWASLRALGEGAEGSEALEFDELIGCAADLAIKALRRDAPKTPGFDAGSPLETFITIRRFIDRNLAAPKLGPEMIAASFGLSRSTLYRLFEPTGGLSAYIRDVRMRRAYEEITSPARANRRIGPAAFALGFRNFSAFSRAFRETYGLTPAKPAKPPPPEPQLDQAIRCRCWCRLCAAGFAPCNIELGSRRCGEEPRQFVPGKLLGERREIDFRHQQQAPQVERGSLHDTHLREAGLQRNSAETVRGESWIVRMKCRPSATDLA